MPAFRLLLPMLLVLSLIGCDGADKAPASPADGMTMRVYSVPADRAGALVYSLNEALAPTKDQALGKVSLGADGQIIVLAPDSLHPSIEKSLQQIVSGAPQEVGNTTPQLRLRMWSVDALPGAGEDSADLEPLDAALGELRKARGVVHFVLRDEVESVSTDGLNVRRTWGAHGVGNAAQVLKYRIDRSAGKRSLNFSFQDSNYMQAEGRSSPSGVIDTFVETTTAAVIGQTLVLASQPVAGADKESPAATRYYIVRIDEVGAD